MESTERGRRRRVASLSLACLSAATIHTLKAGRYVGKNWFFQSEGPQSKIEKDITSVCFKLFFWFFCEPVKTSFFMRLVKTLGQNLGQILRILPKCFYHFLEKVGFHDTLRPA